VGESVHRSRVSWNHGDPEDVRAHTIELAEQTLAASSAPDFGGDSRRADPEELFVASLSSCHMLWFLALARAEKIRVTAYDDEAEGTLDGTRFIRVVLRPRVVFDGEVDAEKVDSLHRRAHERCFISNSVSCPVEVEPPR
jgi:organic hydroperoxide reductase OsmC/OhrA